jgi:hypothetical protein
MDYLTRSAMNPANVEVFAWETESGFALHLLNYTNPNMLSGWFTETYPVANDSARLLL